MSLTYFIMYNMFPFKLEMPSSKNFDTNRYLISIPGSRGKRVSH